VSDLYFHSFCWGILRNGGKTVTIGISSYIKVQPSVGTRNVCNEKVGFFLSSTWLSVYSTKFISTHVFSYTCWSEFVKLLIVATIRNDFNGYDDLRSSVFTFFHYGAIIVWAARYWNSYRFWPYVPPTVPTTQQQRRAMLWRR
jgi:hypothetical protein